MDQLYLASNSPRRWELLQQIGLQPIKIESEIDETPLINEDAKSYCLRIALEKNKAAQGVRSHKNLANLPILTADTTVSVDHQILGKPLDQADAYRMLKLLSGRTHQVFTAVCVSVNGQTFSDIQTSHVEFKMLTDEEIWSYIKTNEPMDKAGAYGIQGLGGIFIRHLSGSFTGVMGLPIAETAILLQKCGIKVI
ncbi:MULTISPECIES: nucleoside triphosphate pyrophosphatase [Glaesserella]|uniref:dTTP/UTP pyrophosphatase n=1 Tax=Glaesserella australis TaxID=2094024 RepID=A0A328BWS3_9PAST|nr:MULTISPECIES: Maf family protein [Glaesserella]AUI65277.1 septum formation inhibitor Maf [Glaesserella sp. 15-184]RAL18549.1 septum formation inhibitor Maf [Glaesserella australis]